MTNEEKMKVVSQLVLSAIYNKTQIKTCKIQVEKYYVDIFLYKINNKNLALHSLFKPEEPFGESLMTGLLEANLKESEIKDLIYSLKDIQKQYFQASFKNVDYLMLKFDSDEYLKSNQ